MTRQQQILEEIEQHRTRIADLKTELNRLALREIPKRGGLNHAEARS